MALDLVIEPAAEPVTVDQLKAHADVLRTDQDAILEIYIKAARRRCEGLLGRALIDQTWVQRMDQFGTIDANGCLLSDIRLGKPKVRSITSVTYIDADGVEQTLAADQYLLDGSTLPGYLLPAYGVDWPETQDRINAVAITFVAGFGADGSAVPDDIKAWILMTAATLYANRESVDVMGKATGLPNRFLDGLLDPWTVYGV